MKPKIKFGVFADLHVDIIHDGELRMEKFVEACRKENVDFVIQLGDYCYPETRKCVCQPDKRPINIENALNYPTYVNKERIVGLFKDFEKPSYHVLGNHDCDMCSKREVLDNYGEGYEPYYSFDMGGIHFIVLDPNYYVIDGKYYSFENGNYFDESYHEERVLPALPPEQIKWLEEDLAKTQLPSVLFSHQGLSGELPADILNAKEVVEILKKAPAGVIASFNGHTHFDYAQQVEGIWFVAVNSMSNQWLDMDFICEERYGKEIDEKFPNIKYTAPYRDSIFAIVTIDEQGIDIKGVESEFVGPSPDELGLYEPGTWWSGYGDKVHSTPSIENRYLPIMKKIK